MLVAQCRDTVERVFSMERPRALTGGEEDDNDDKNGDAPPPRKKQKKRNGKTATPSTRPDVDTHYFPRFFAEAYGPLDPLSHKVVHSEAGASEAVIFPKNIRFEVGDWAAQDVDGDEDGWDVILAWVGCYRAPQ